MMSKKLICVALICTWGLAAGAWADLVGYWKLDDGAGTTAVDSSGNGGNGTLEGDPQWVAGMIGGALEFDGDDAVNCGDILPLTDALTIACWVNPAGLSGDNGWVARERCYAFKSGGASLKFTTPGILDHTATDTTLEIGTWQHVAVTFAPGQAEGAVFYLNGVEAQRLDASAINPGNAPFLIGNNEWDQFYEGQIDEVRVYDHILSEADILASMFGEDYPFAIALAPKKGSMIGVTGTTLEWRAGEFAVSHDVYLGESLEEVEQATPDSDVFQGNQATTEFAAADLTPGQTYYWRIDEINDAEPNSPWKGEVWSFWVQPDIAWAPSPTDGVSYIDPDQDLTWEKGLGTLFHTVYFGESFEEVNDAVAGGIMVADAVYDPATLELGKTYYWRVDEFISPMQTNKGAVWSFSTLPDIPVTDESLLAWWTLDEGEGTTVVDWSGHGHHGTLGGDAQWQDGYFGGAVGFDGSGDSVNLGTPEDLYLTQNYTYTAWFKVGQNINGNSGAQYLLCIGSRSDLIFGVEDNVGVDGDLMLHYYDTEGTFHAVGVGKTVWSADEWHMVAGTRDENGHNIYLDGELRNSDTNVNEDNFGGATTRIISLGARAWTGHQYYNGLIDDVRIYNRALTESEIQQVMRGNPLLAGSPNPGPGAVVDIRDATALRWVAGDTAASHDVYFGTDKAALELQGNQPGTGFSLAGLVELGGGDYFWRIDEVEADGTVQTGYVWRFNVPDFLTVDDFESYSNEVGSRVFETWIDGIGFTLPEPGNPGNGTGAAVGHDIWSVDSPYLDGSIMETGNVHGGAAAMPIYYDNTFAPARSEADCTFTPGQNWTVEGVTTLVVHFRGEADNTGDLYVKINGVKVPYDGDPADIASDEWIAWEIDLATVGVSLTNITSMTIGIEAGQAGVLYIDDILLTKAN